MGPEEGYTVGKTQIFNYIVRCSRLEQDDVANWLVLLSGSQGKRLSRQALVMGDIRYTKRDWNNESMQSGRIFDPIYTTIIWNVLLRLTC